MCSQAINQRLQLASVLVGLFLYAIGGLAQASTPVINEVQRLLAADAAPGDWFGYSVALDGDTALIGARFADSSRGAAYVFVRGPSGVWSQQAELLPIPTGPLRGNFGYSVALDGNTAVVGSSSRNVSGDGVAYVFVRDASGVWSQQAILLATDLQNLAGFANSVDLNGDTVLVGAPGEDSTGLSDNGAAYVFVRDSSGAWSQQAKLLASDAATEDYFGWSVAVDGDTALIGAYAADSRGPNGAAYVFTRSDSGVWSQQAKLVAADAGGVDRFGWSVDLEGDTAMIGAILEDANNIGLSGAAYAFIRDASGVWVEQDKLFASDAEYQDYFGFSVDLDGDSAIISAIFANAAGLVDTGAAYLFARDPSGVWVEQAKLVASDVAPLDHLGWWNGAAALNQGTAVVGTVFKDAPLTDQGAAYVFEITLDDQGPDTNNVQLNPNPVAAGVSVSISADVDDTNTGGSSIASANYTIDGGVANLMAAGDGAFDEVFERVTATVPGDLPAGVYDVCVRGTDSAGNTGSDACTLLAVYDPTAGFVTGGGWFDSPAGAYIPDPTLTGRASFGFVSKYKKGQQTPTGNTEFQFKAGGLNFRSTAYDWLVIAGHKAKYKGGGTINGMGNYGFMLFAVDANLTPSTDVDLFRIKIWDKNAGDAVVYDNEVGAAENAEATTAIGGGSIVIHKKD